MKPDLTFLLDVPPEIGLSRKRAGANDRFEKEEVAFHQKVRAGFLQLATEEPHRWVVIDATLPRTRGWRPYLGQGAAVAGKINVF